MINKKYIKTDAPEDFKLRAGEVHLSIYGEGIDEKGEKINYLIRNERVDVLRLENEIEREEKRLEDLKSKLKVAKGE